MWILIIISILILVALISVLKIQPFISFIIVSLFLGVANGLSSTTLIDAIQKGIGATLGSIIVIIVLGAMIGKMIAKSDATTVIADKLVAVLGPKRLPFAFMIIGFIVGLPLFYSVAFLLLVPLVLSTAKRHQINAVYLGVPMLASLSITQGFLPPHPAPYYLASNLPGADIGIILGIGILISLPAMLIAGWLFGKSLRFLPNEPMNFTSEENQQQLPSFGLCVFVLLLPVLLIALHSFSSNKIVLFLSEPIVALLISLLAAIYLIGIRRGIAWQDIQVWLLDAVKEISPLMLTIGGAGAFKEILQAMHLGDEILILTADSTINPLIIAWLIAAALRIVTGSSTVAGITTAGLILPILASTGMNPNLLALSIGSGSLVMSHVNDTGFWLFKEYFGVSIKDSLKSWTVMETIISVVGLLGVLVIDHFI